MDLLGGIEDIVDNVHTITDTDGRDVKKMMDMPISDLCKLLYQYEKGFTHPLYGTIIPSDKLNSLIHRCNIRSIDNVTNSGNINKFECVEMLRAWALKNNITHSIIFISKESGKYSNNNHIAFFMKHDNVHIWVEAYLDSHIGLHRFNNSKDAINSLIKVFKGFPSNADSNIKIGILGDSIKLPMSYNDYISMCNKTTSIPIDGVIRLMESSIIYEADDSNNDPPELEEDDEEDIVSEDEPTEEVEEEIVAEDELVDEPADDAEEDIVSEDEPTEEVEEEIVAEEEPVDEPTEEVELSAPKQADEYERDRNGVRRKMLYIAFIEWCKSFNAKNTFGSIFDKNVFNTTYPFMPNDLRYFYRLADPMLCVLSGRLTFFSLSEIKKINIKNDKFPELIVFAASTKDYRVFNTTDSKVYFGVPSGNSIELKNELAPSFDIYIQNMVNNGDYLNAKLKD